MCFFKLNIDDAAGFNKMFETKILFKNLKKVVVSHILLKLCFVKDYLSSI